MSRLAAGEPELAAGISRTNRENLLEQLDAISNSLMRLRRHLEADDPRLVELFEEARAVRERWAADTRSQPPPPPPPPRGGGRLPLYTMCVRAAGSPARASCP